MTVLNELDRFPSRHGRRSTACRKPVNEASTSNSSCKEKLIEHKQYIDKQRAGPAGDPELGMECITPECGLLPVPISGLRRRDAIVTMQLPFGGTIFTIGHSTRSFAEFVAILCDVGVTMVVDVRSFPRSRTAPQFNVGTLPGALRRIRHRLQAPPRARRTTASSKRDTAFAQHILARDSLPELRRLRGD